MMMVVVVEPTFRRPPLPDGAGDNTQRDLRSLRFLGSALTGSGRVSGRSKEKRGRAAQSEGAQENLCRGGKVAMEIP